MRSWINLFLFHLRIESGCSSPLNTYIQRPDEIHYVSESLKLTTHVPNGRGEVVTWKPYNKRRDCEYCITASEIRSHLNFTTKLLKKGTVVLFFSKVTLLFRSDKLFG